ncbi:Interleukin-12 receptor subunit beta-1 [Oryzias melastigma]|uniref:Interleukin-12 receptor subunit beta-1 n=1 Tax=Oryzias melastigma TaxID=30732 RepID=A0A834KUJ8_ORYME|nr:Interleukin-12 receptor subunit beta-1 [Oryzias melastigma]
MGQDVNFVQALSATDKTAKKLFTFVNGALKQTQVMPGLTFTISSEKKFGETKENPYDFVAEQLIVGSKIDIWIEAHTSSSNCVSPKWSGVLMDRVKYMAPQNISVSWLTNSLILRWPAPEEHPALAEVRILPNGGPTESSETRLINTTFEAGERALETHPTEILKYKLLVANLQKNTAYRVSIRHRSTKAKDPLWSNWSTPTVVPAELEHEPDITNTVTLENGHRKVKLTWKPMPSAAAVRGVKYIVKDTQSSRDCPCKRKKKQPSEQDKNHIVYVSYSSVNITVVAKNPAGLSPQAVIRLPVASAANLTICNKTLLDGKLKKKSTCVELYELQDDHLEPKNVVILTARMRKEKREQLKRNMSDYIRYLYFEHRCVNGKPQTDQMCFFYKKEGVPNKEPQDFIVSHETQNSAQIFWKPVPYEHQRGFLTHYSLCIVKINSQKDDCFNISTSKTSHRLGNLTPGTKYNVSLAGVTRMGKGHQARTFFTTLSEVPVNVWLSLGLLIGFFFFSTMCTIVLKRIRNTIFPPVPTPVIPDFTARQPDSEQKWERKEEVHEVTLHQLLQEGTSISEKATVFREEWNGGTEVESEGSHSEGSSDECESSNSTSHALRKSNIEIEQMDVELAMLIYRNGLVFDVKGESP